MNQPKIEEQIANGVCPFCGASVDPPRVTAKDVAVTILCSVLLLATVIPVVWTTERWMEDNSQKILIHMIIWREPIESWNR